MERISAAGPPVCLLAVYTPVPAYQRAGRSVKDDNWKKSLLAAFLKGHYSAGVDRVV